MAKLLKVPENGVTIRMYRQGHGDCFLLAFPREQGGDPFYVLIDCGLKPGSQDYIHKQKIDKIVEHIGASTNFHLDLVIITHEHQDHLNGIWKKTNPYFKGFKIEKAWFAWTENPLDEYANALRKKHNDQLLQLVNARQQLALAIGENNPTINRLDNFISLEFGGESDQFNLNALRAAVADPNKSENKQSMKLIKDKANERQGVEFLYPGGKPCDIKGTAGIRAFVLGPPKSEKALRDEDPVGDEGFPQDEDVHPLSFSAAIMSSAEERATPFHKRYCVSKTDALIHEFFQTHYGEGEAGASKQRNAEVSGNAPWRRIDSEWLYSAESLALKNNIGVNNTSVVLAFELPKTKKILLFAGDAQRGNWYSWKDVTWDDNGKEVKTRDLLARTVLYKVGHHGSHNATLNGQENDVYANLSWMGREAAKDEFTAMITAVNKWAMEKNNPPWHHPLESIRTALIQKAQGRVFQTDIAKPEKPTFVSDATWNDFLKRSTFEELYFDYTVIDA